MDKPQRNHISTVILQAIKYIRSNWFLFIMIFANNKLLVSLGISLGVFILMIIYSSFVWYNKKFYIKENVLHYESGVISKNRLTLNREKISTIDIGQTFLQRVLGVCRLKIDSGSTNLGKTEIDIVLGKDYIDEFKKALDSAYTNNSDIKSDLPKDRSNVFKSDSKEIFLLALTKGKLGLIVTIIVSSLTFLDDLLDTFKIDIGKYVDGYFNIDEIIKKSIGELAIFIIQIVIVSYIISFILSIIISFIKYYDFKVYKDNGKINIQYGLINLKKYSLPMGNIQAVKLKQNFMNQIFNQYKVEVVTAGYGNEEKEEAILYPLADKNRLKVLLENLLPEFNFENIEIKSPPKKALRRFFVFPMTLNIIVYTVISLIFHKAILLFMLMPIVTLACYFEYKNNTIGYDERILYGGFGAFSKIIVIIKMNSVQSITEGTNYFQRKMGVCNYKIDFYSNKLVDILAIKNMHKNHFKEIESKMEF